MNVYEGLETIPQPFARSTVAIGTFDGVHVGHHFIIRTAVSDAHEHGRPGLVFTFDRHPAELLAPDRVPGYLTTPLQRILAISELGVDALVVARFDADLALLEPEAFVRDILKGLLGAESLIVGSNFQFGRDRTGDVAFLAGLQSRYDFTLHALEPVLVEGKPASSSRIRECLRSGAITEAEAVLGRPYWLVGKVVTGQRLGRTLGYPTANLARTYSQVVPMDGIYAVLVELEDGRQVGGACSIGDRPTIAGAGRSIETYLFDFNEDLYERTMAIRFLKRLRSEEKFDSLSALISQIERDVAEARQVVDVTATERNSDITP